MASQNDLHSAYENVTKAYNAISSGPNFNPAAKAQLKKAALDLIAATQTPQEAARGFLMSNAVHPCYRIAGDCGIFAALTKGPTPMSASQLSERTGADLGLIVRIMRVLTGAGVFTENGEELYSHNALSTIVGNPGSLAHVKFMAPAIARLPEYFSLNSYASPSINSSHCTPYQYGNSTPLTFYQALSSSPTARAAFDSQMESHVLAERRTFSAGFASTYPFESIITPLVSSPQSVALVDVGGSKGHVLEDIMSHLPSLPGRLILQDLPETLATVALPEQVETMPYNFLVNRQPVHGAAVYLFRQIFLNWTDSDARTILRNTHAALTLGHSRLLVMEPVLPPMGVPLPLALLDIQMLQMGGGLRTEKQWRNLLEEEGFEVKRFLPSQSGQTVIEAFKVDKVNGMS